jgi:hypothetical protein
MAYGKSYVLPENTQSKTVLAVKTALTIYIIPMTLSFLSMKLIRGTVIIISELFDPQLSGQYYNSNPCWLSY